MNPTERWADSLEALRKIVEGQLAETWTALPGIVESVSGLGGAMTVTVQPSVQASIITTDNLLSYQTLPTIPDVPVVWPHGGGYTMTFPIQPGDECLIVFASRAIDNWWQSGGIQRPNERRLHDLSDAFAIVGPRSQAKKISGISLTTVQLRSDDGSQFVEIDTPNKKINLQNGEVSGVFDNGAGAITLTAPQTINLNAPTTNISGVLNVEGQGASGGAVGTINGSLHVTGEVIGGYGSTSIALTTHYHANSGGTGDGGPPVSGS